MNEAASAGGRLRILDAGCGVGYGADFPPDAHVVGIDISEAALARNRKLDERILGDLQSYPLPSESFDLVVCHYVLEHVEDPRAAVRNLAASVRRGGELDISIPILWSAKGLLTKLTPHRFHVWCYRRLFHFENAGKDGYGPFPTTLAITPRRLEEDLAALGLEPVTRKTWRATLGLPRALGLVWNAIGVVERVLLPARGATEYRARFRKVGPS